MLARVFFLPASPSFCSASSSYVVMSVSFQKYHTISLNNALYKAVTVLKMTTSEQLKSPIQILQASPDYNRRMPSFPNICVGGALIQQAQYGYTLVINSK